MKYRKKPVIIEAHQWLIAHNAASIIEWAKQTNSTLILDTNELEWDYDAGCYIYEGHFIHAPYGERHLAVYTLEGWMIANLGDYIIKGLQNEFYPCKSDIFEASYEAVE